MPRHKTAKPDLNARAKLLACATELFNRRGYAATTVREIVEAAGVTKPVLYYYFGNKEGIYREIVGHLLQEFEEKLEACRRQKGGVAKRVLNFCEEMFSLFLDHIDYVRLVYSICFGPPQEAPFFDFDEFYAKLRAAVRETVEEGIRSGEFRRADPDDITYAILGALTVAIELRLTHPEMATGNKDLARLLHVIFSGIAARKPKRKVNKQ